MLKPNITSPFATKNSFQISINMRMIAHDLDITGDPELFRLLQFDCDGNLMGEAGTYLPFDENLPSTVAYTGFIDGVFNITHTDVFLEDCSIIALARGEVVTSVENDPLFDSPFKLSQNFPNPFATETEIYYELPTNAHVEISVFNYLGKKVKNLVSSKQNPRNYVVRWNGKNDSGKDLPNGVYFYRMELRDIGNVGSSPLIKTEKAILLR